MNTIVNPETGKTIKVGGNTHKSLILKGVLTRESLDTGKVSIVEGSRQKMPLPAILHYPNSTHFTNVKEISEAIGCSLFEIAEWFSKEFDTMKLCYSKTSTTIILPQYEPFIENILKDFITDFSKRNKLDITHWNQ